MTDLNLIIDTMLPGDLELGMPSASEIDFDIYLNRNDLISLSLEFIHLLDKTCTGKYGLIFSEMDQSIKLQAINACKLSNVRLFSTIVTHLLKAYYSTPSVLVKIGAGSVPPFPNGNIINEDEWSILEPVYERGHIYKEITPTCS